MISPATLADHLDARTDAIIGVWRSAVAEVGDVPRAEGLSDDELIDHIPEILDRLIERLRGRPGDAVDEGRKHGRLRWRQGFGIAEIILELGHLRTALNQATFGFARERHGDLSTIEAALSAIDDVLNEATSEAVHHFHA